MKGWKLPLGHTKVIMLTTFDLDEYVERALRASASGFLLKTVTHEELVNAVHVVVAGDALLAPTTTRRLLDRYLALPPIQDQSRANTDARLDALTAREIDVLRLIADGKSNIEIAELLFVTEHTVKSHVSRILTKTGLRDRTQAIVLAYDTRLVQPRTKY